MNGSATKLMKYMEGSSKRFVIPVYQRNYDWRTENCKQLYDDLVKIIRDKRNSHFFGSIVSAHDENGEDEEYLVIDGQQRLTTVSLLLLAMYNLMDQGLIHSQSPVLKQKILEEYLVDKWAPEETRIKLKPIKNDQQAFKKLFDDRDNYIRGSNLTVNYDYFYDRIQKQEITIDELFSALNKLEIIKIILNSNDNPQLVFESLNSTGLSLSEGDKIRNFILMGLPVKEQERFYDKYWNQIELLTNYDVSSFIRDYLTIKQQSIPPKSKVYTKFKDYVSDCAVETESLLQDMLAYAKRYQKLLNGNTGDKSLDASIYRLNRLETTVTRPFFLEVLRLYDEKRLSMKDLNQIFQLLENYIFRRSICKLPTNGLNSTFQSLHHEIMRYDGTESDYVEKLKYNLLNRRENTRFPSNEEFAESLVTRPIYEMESKNKIYLLERLENYGTNEDKDVYRHIDDGSYTIEHIMPQHLTPVWQKELGDHYDEIHEEWLHRLANLTLTGYNAHYSNSSFTEKKNMKNGFLDSGIRMNAWIARQDEWTEKELVERSELLKEKALQIWNQPVTKYQPVQKQLDSCTLADDEDLTNRNISRYAFKQMEQPVKSWPDMMVKVVRNLYEQDKSIIERLAVSTDEGLAQFFSMNTESFSRGEEIGDGIYLLTAMTTQRKLSVLTSLFKLYGEQPEDLVFYLREEEKLPDEHDPWGEKRKKFWTYALPIINDGFEGNSPFITRNPRKANDIYSVAGAPGLYLYCRANMKAASVQLHFNYGDKIINKLNFDNLEKQKSEIESALGAALVWDRNDSGLLSKVSIDFPGVNVVNEQDWPAIADFLSKWSVKFSKYLVPIAEQNFQTSKYS